MQVAVYLATLAVIAVATRLVVAPPGRRAAQLRRRNSPGPPDLALPRCRFHAQRAGMTTRQRRLQLSARALPRVFAGGKCAAPPWRHPACELSAPKFDMSELSFTFFDPTDADLPAIERLTEHASARPFAKTAYRLRGAGLRPLRCRSSRASARSSSARTA